MSEPHITVTEPTILIIDGERVVPLGHLHTLVESRSREGEYHSVSWEWNDDSGKEEWTCSCEGWSFRHDCRHIRAVDRWVAGKASVRIEGES